ncbi:MAG: hypothetical protein ACYDGL_00855 [Bellilinea sp.]
MKRPLQKPDWDILQQIPLGLEIDEVESGTVTPDEARMRSEAARKLFDEAQDKPEWFARYAELRSAGWSWRVACYIAWASCPRKSRDPKSQEELATKVLGLTSDRQIWTWRTKNPAIDETVALLQAAPLFEHRADILRALIDSATDPDYKHHQDRKIALEMMGDYVPRVQLEDDRRRIDDLDQLPEEELRQLANQGKSVQIEREDEGDDGND